MDRTFDIFEGEPGKDPIWIACASGIAAAKATMDQIAKSKPGKYFVWESQTNTILAITDTLAKLATGATGDSVRS